MKKDSRARKNPNDKGVEQFSEEVEHIGKKLEEGGKNFELRFNRIFGPLGPLVKSLIALLGLMLVIWALVFVNIPFANSILVNVNAYLTVNIFWFFLLFVIFSYVSYISEKIPDGKEIVSPAIAAAGITVAFWILMQLLTIINTTLSNAVLAQMINFMGMAIFWVFGIVLALGYLVVIARRFVEMESKTERKPKKEKGKTIAAVNSNMRRLYRSGNDRILGGVCGGIGEYLGIDPVLIRLLWVFAILAFGSGLLLYIIAWIIIPRNPKHKWN